MREAIARHAEDEGAREKLRHEVIAAWDSYIKTGLHVTFENADAWLVKLEGSPIAKRPRCHK